jgi:hypothetical protein
MQADVTTTATRYLCTIHDFIMLNPITDTPAARGAIAQASHTHKEVKIIIFIIHNLYKYQFAIMFESL